MYIVVKVLVVTHAIFR